MCVCEAHHDAEVLHELVELAQVLLVHLGDGESGGGLLVHELTETGLALNNAVGHVHLAAEGGQPEHQLHGVDIVGDDDHLGLLGLDELGDVVQAILDVLGLGALVDILVLGLGLSGGHEALLLLGLGLRAVLGQKAEQVGGWQAHRRASATKQHLRSYMC